MDNEKVVRTIKRISLVDLGRFISILLRLVDDSDVKV